MEYGEKVKKLEESLKDKKVALCFSGGSDSSLLAYVGANLCKEIILFTFDNGLFPKDFIRKSKEQADKFNLKQIIVKDKFIKDEEFCKNNEKRCLICRNKIYSSIKKLAEENNLDYVIDGNNISDFLEDRPGIIAKYEYNIESPLIDAGFETRDVHRFLKEHNIKYNKSTTCLATRIETNKPITRNLINRINTAEKIVENITKNDIVKVRKLNSYAIIETDNIEPLLNVETLQLIEDEFKAIGFKKIGINITEIKDNDEKLYTYRGCQTKNNKVMFTKNLPYEIDIEETINHLSKEFSDVEYFNDRGLILFSNEDVDISISKNGKIIIDNVDIDKGEDFAIKILKLIRRTV
ncbi:TIGR00268 family protein [uncultured Methanobrevibacter sp.]|uniref:TIGR00268 family protein n=1 Tax=uncultured Methanobrevibacter sp. TaxID=253161 RepID=UPI00258DFB89|nr:TIGR00268 family protein [uncultured Methanobrevibacter sp.]